MRVFVDDGRIGNGLTNGGDGIILRHALGDTVDLYIGEDWPRARSMNRWPENCKPADLAVPCPFVPHDSGGGDDRLSPGVGREPPVLAPPNTIINLSYRSRSSIDQSLALAADGEWVLHSDLPGRDPMSPGMARPVYGSFSVDTLEVLIAATFDAPAVHGIAPDGEAELISADLITWVSCDGKVVTFEEDSQTPVALAPGTARIAAWRDRLPLAEGIVRVRRRRNQPPSIVSVPDTLAYRGGHYRYQVRAVDAEGDELRYAIPIAPEWLKIERTSGLLYSSIPDTARETFPVLVKVAERSGRSVEQRFAVRVIDRPRVRIAEILSDPPFGSDGDANGNGVRETYGDEFFEIHNVEGSDVDIGGWLLSSGDVPQSRQFRFPHGTVIAAGARAVLFGANAPPVENRFSDDGRIGDGLGNRDEDLFLVSPSGPDTIDWVSVSLRKEPNQSLLFPEAPACRPFCTVPFLGGGSLLLERCDPCSHQPASHRRG